MSDFVLPATRYALSGDVNIAYQTMGEGPIDIIIVPGIVSHVEFMHEGPGYTAFLRRLSTFARVVTFDKRGQGLSDRVAGAPALEQRMDDVRAIMDDIGSPRATIFGLSEGGAMSIMFAAAYPERVAGLILFGSFAKAGAGHDPDSIERFVKVWGTGVMVELALPSQAGNPETVAMVAKFERLSTSPGALRTLMRMNAQIDVRPILPTVRVPTLVLHRRTDTLVPVEEGRKLAAQIPDAKYIEYPDGDHLFCLGDTEGMLGDIEEFVTGARESAAEERERVLATVLFTDIVDSTRRAAEAGDHAWRRLLDDHDRLAKLLVEKHRGCVIKTTGDGILATFDGPGRAVRCALALGATSRQIGLTLRAGLHTGEIELRGHDIGGVAVHAAARVMAHCESGEVLVSRVVTRLEHLNFASC